VGNVVIRRIFVVLAVRGFFIAIQTANELIGLHINKTVSLLSQRPNHHRRKIPILSPTTTLNPTTLLLPSSPTPFFVTSSTRREDQVFSPTIHFLLSLFSLKNSIERKQW
jgi:hypothetical protein